MNAAPNNFTPSFHRPPARSSLPRPVTFPLIWPGFLTAGICLSFELTSGFVSGLPHPGDENPLAAVFLSLAIVAYIVGMVLWFRWVFQLHKFLHAMDPSYPISSAKAVGFQFIPFFSRYWDFRWTNRITNFVRRNAPRTKMSKGWLGVWLFLASLMIVFDRGFELFALFGISAYLSRKLKRVPCIGLMTYEPAQQGARYARIGPPRYARIGQPGAAAPCVFPPAPIDPATAAAWDLRMAREWKLPVSAGIGAAFGFLLCYGFWFMLKAVEQDGTMFKGLATEAFKILLVATVLYFYLEPLSEKLLTTFHVVEEQHAAKVFWKKIFRFGVIVVVVDVAHSLLERATAETSSLNIVSLGILLTFFFGGMTYLWICGAPKRLRDAVILIGPGTVLLLILGAAVIYDAKPFQQKLGETANHISNIDLKNLNLERELGNFAGPSEVNKLASTIAPELKDENEKNGAKLAIVLTSALFVALAGFVTMRKKLGPVAVAGTVFFSSLLSSAVLIMVTPHPQDDGIYVVTTLWAAFWWCLGMLAFYDHDIFHANAVLTATAQERIEKSFTPLVWIATSVILVGLIIAAYKVRPKIAGAAVTPATNTLSKN